MSEAKERPILFSGPMVRALLSGAKTQTRRVVKSPAKNMQREGMKVIQRREPGDPWYKDYVWSMRGPTGVWGDYTHEQFLSLCPYGQPGDRLWVRETHAWVDRLFEGFDREDPMVVAYQANKEVREHAAGRSVRFDARHLNWDAVRWRPSIHMPRWASRLTLEVTGVRVERVQDISEEDARAEGVIETRLGMAETSVFHVGEWPASSASATAAGAFAALWREINGAESWERNPWVWVVEFRRVT